MQRAREQWNERRVNTPRDVSTASTYFTTIDGRAPTLSVSREKGGPSSTFDMHD
jgi:hypothetical protein